VGQCPNTRRIGFATVRVNGTVVLKTIGLVPLLTLDSLASFPVLVQALVGGSVELLARIPQEVGTDNVLTHSQSNP